ncbi:MAG: UV DNA damage repair endonuclease UvsE [Veillonellales bacterium]
MMIRFGYVAMALNILQGSPNKTMTVAGLSKISEQQDRLTRLRRIVRENLTTQMRVLRYNAAHDIHVFRFTSKLIPLATHPSVSGWNYREEFQTELAEIGEFVREHGMRVSSHPDHFTVLNSPEPKVVEAAKGDLAYHAGIFDAMGLGAEAKLVIHVGGVYQNKELALERFKESFSGLSPEMQNRLMLENDDKSYSAADVLGLCRQLGRPMVLDVHHHSCYNTGETLEEMLPEIFATWRDMMPKIHVSSSKSAGSFRSHADYIHAEEFVAFLHKAKPFGADFDVMIEAKQKDKAMFQLLADLRQVPGVNFIDQATIEY